MAEIDRLRSIGFSAWIDEQFTVAPLDSHYGYTVRGGQPNCDPTGAQFPACEPVGTNTSDTRSVLESFWLHAVTGRDQLRQRMVAAFLEIMVVGVNGILSTATPERAIAAYLDMLARNSFGNFRTLIEEVTRSPAMGFFLTYHRNEREDPASGRIPDENYAREVMQLFTIGLSELNPDGTFRLDGSGNRIPTYGQAEIAGMARVFTGLSWGGPDFSDAAYNGAIYRPTNEAVPYDQPMKIYPNHASTSEKRIIRGVIIPAGTPGDESLRIALDTLFNHPNVGPFIGEQLIKRLVTSNPSRNYVSRVSAAFNNNGTGVRGDLRAVIRAILLDPEARDPRNVTRADWGKLREPMIRFGNWLRAFNASSRDQKFRIPSIENNAFSFGQNPARAPSVFNFFRPDFAPPGAIRDRGLRAPEFQITHETSVAGYTNTIVNTARNGHASGAGQLLPDYSAEIALADRPDALLDRLNLLLFAGQLTDGTRAIIRTALESAALPATNDAAARRLRVEMAVALSMASPEYVVQK